MAVLLFFYEDYVLPGFARGEDHSRVSQITLNVQCERVRAAEYAPRGPFRGLERRHGLAEIVERGGGVLVERFRSRRFVNSVELWYDENCIYDENPHYAEAVPIGNGTLARGLDGFKLFMQNSAARALTTDCFVADYRRGDPSYTNGVWRRG